jgi:hypothetical protein
MWFIQGSTFEEWKENGSLLWVRGNRAFSFLSFPFVAITYSPGLAAGSGKSVLWQVVFQRL